MQAVKLCTNEILQFLTGGAANAICKVKVKWSIAVRRRLTATGTHVPYGITQYYLLPGRDDIPAFTPAEAGTRLSDPEGIQG